MEISIIAGQFELLVVGGYVYRYGISTPFLGSSVSSLKLSEETSTSIEVPALSSGVVLTTRLLNQYVKRCSHKLMGYHCSKSFENGLYPISPAELLDHASQKLKKLNNHHLFSAVLNLISSPKAIKHDDLEAIWLLLIRLPFFGTATATSSTTPTNFAEMPAVLGDSEDNNLLSSLIKILDTVHLKATCFFLSVFNETKTKVIALKIVKSGLKTEIERQHRAIIDKVRNSL